MKTSDIDQFFEILAQQLDKSATVILTGGAAALLLGGVRPTKDIDFEVSTQEPWPDVGNAIHKTEKQTRIPSQFSEDIDRWSMITLLDYRKHTRPYKKFGKLKVLVLEPAYWSIGKMTRYWDSDIVDLRDVFREQGTRPSELITVWKRALKKSPRSEAQFHFQKHVESFLTEHGTTIWGRDFDPAKHLKTFGLPLEKPS